VAITFHLTPLEVWTTQRHNADYAPEAFASEGFIHCTDGESNVIDVGNRYYTGDPREMVCLVIDRDAVRAEIRYEDPGHIFPHIYGPLNVDAVQTVRGVDRETDGRFTRIGSPISV
jgi:uncharacterized protein (DUF952 family)